MSTSFADKHPLLSRTFSGLGRIGGHFATSTAVNSAIQTQKKKRPMAWFVLNTGTFIGGSLLRIFGKTEEQRHMGTNLISVTGANAGANLTEAYEDYKVEMEQEALDQAQTHAHTDENNTYEGDYDDEEENDDVSDAEWGDIDDEEDAETSEVEHVEAHAHSEASQSGY